MPALSAAGLARNLLGLHRQAFAGRLQVRLAELTLQLEWQGGVPVSVRSDLPGGTLVERLAAAGLLGERDVADVKTRLAKPGTAELVAIAATRKLGPKELLRALTDQLSDAIATALAAAGSELSVEPAALPAGAAAPIPFDVPAAVANAIARRWSPAAQRAALGARLDQAPRLAAAGSWPGRLPGGPALAGLLGSLDGTRSAAQLLDEAPAAAPALFVLDALGELGWQQAETGAGDAPEAAPEAAGEAESEIEIIVTTQRGPAAGDGDAAGAARQAAARDEKGDALREEIAGLHGRLKTIDHYTLLGVERGVAPALLKRAYLKLAKRLHPDALARLGLDDVKEQANEVFARITRAHEVLSDPDERRNYDASLDGHASVDAERLGQAEAQFRKGEVMMRAGNFLGALPFLDAAVQLWPDEPEYLAALAWTLYRKNPPDTERAIAVFERATAADAGKAQVWLRFSLAVKSAGDPARAAELAAKARALDPQVKA